MLPSLRNRASAVLTWNLALDPTGGPNHGGCQTCSGTVTIGPDGTIERNAEYAILGQLSRYVPPGSVRVDSNDAVPNVAFRTPHDRTVVVWNPDEGSRRITIGDGSTTVRVDLAGRLLTTVTM